MTMTPLMAAVARDALPERPKLNQTPGQLQIMCLLMSNEEIPRNAPLQRHHAARQVAPVRS